LLRKLIEKRAKVKGVKAFYHEMHESRHTVGADLVSARRTEQTVHFRKSPSAGGRGRCANSTSQRGSDCDPGAVGGFPTDGVGVKRMIPTAPVGVDALGDPPEWHSRNTRLGRKTLPFHPL